MTFPQVVLIALTAALTAVWVQAHDPTQHTEETRDIDCSAMHSTDGIPPDTQDPVMQAMMMRCDMSSNEQNAMKEQKHMQEVSKDGPIEAHHSKTEHGDTH